MTIEQDLSSVVEELRLHKHAIDEHAIVAITDPRGVITYINDKFCKISGYEPEELIGKTHRVVNSGTHPKSFFVDMWRAISSGKTWHGEICNRAKDGSLYWVDSTIVPFYDIDGNLTQYVSIRADVTERRAAEKLLKKTNDQLTRINDELEQFVYTASHDLKSPIVTMQGYLSYLQRDLSEGRTDRAPEFIERLALAADRMRQCVDDLLELSKIGRVTTNPQMVDLNEVVRSVVDSHKLELKELDVEVSVEPDLPTVYIDPNRLTDVIDNLLTNAIKYGVDNDEPVITIGGGTQEGGSKFFVQDNGNGIAPEYHSKVFSIFERLDTSKSGTGIGLSLVKKTVENGGGSIWLESIPGQGATFWISLPGYPDNE
ncbi:MAG: ATP-binding protein [Planctomycetota bacterium]